MFWVVSESSRTLALSRTGSGSGADAPRCRCSTVVRRYSARRSRGKDVEARKTTMAAPVSLSRWFGG